jgi:hypothetical protein
MFPQDGLGAGAFTALFKNTHEGEKKILDIDTLSAIWINMYGND